MAFGDDQGRTEKPTPGGASESLDRIDGIEAYYRQRSLLS